MKIVVIGGTGLIGSKLVGKLREAGHVPLAASPSSGVDTSTGKGLAEALARARVVVDVSNAPAWDDAAVMDFFQTSARNISAAETAAGVSHHVVLSVVGTERLQDSGYFRAKLAQEEAVRAAPVPYTILRATQFFEFLGRIADSSSDGETVRLPPVLIQPEAADDVAAALADVALSTPFRTVPVGRARSTCSEREERPAPSDPRCPRTLLRRRAGRPLSHARRQRTHCADPLRRLATFHDQRPHRLAFAPTSPEQRPHARSLAERALADGGLPSSRLVPTRTRPRCLYAGEVARREQYVHQPEREPHRANHKKLDREENQARI
jgi:hypothetical protein